MALWLRLYTEVLNDPKVQLLPADVFRTWVNLLCIAKEADQSGDLPDEKSMAFQLRLSPDQLQSHLKTLTESGLIDGIHMHGWEFRQYDSDSDPTALDRKRKQRDKQRNPQNGQPVTREVTDDVTRDNTVTVTDGVTPLSRVQSQSQSQREIQSQSNTPPTPPRGEEERFEDDPPPKSTWTRPEVDRLLQLWDSLKLPPFRRTMANISTADSSPIWQGVSGFSPGEAEQAMRNFARLYHDPDRFKPWPIPTPVTFLSKHIGIHLDVAKPFEQFAKPGSANQSAKVAAALAAAEDESA